MTVSDASSHPRRWICAKACLRQSRIVHADRGRLAGFPGRDGVLGIARRLFHTGLVTTVCVKSRIAQFSLTNHMELAGAWL
jgi:hypothetical protein